MTIQSIAALVLALSLLIIFHEWGHFLFARLFGIFVERFSIGFGPKLFSFRSSKKTEFCVAALPLGGYVKMKGEEPEATGEVAKPEPDSFAAKSVTGRSLVVLAGPLMNFGLAFLLMPLVFWIGHKVSAELLKPALIQEVEPNSPASRAGLKPGDKIVEIDGQVVNRWEEALEKIALAPGKKLEIQVERHRLREVIPVQIEELAESGIGYLGVELGISPLEPIVYEVDSDGPAGRSGLKPGDRIVKINDRRVKSWSDMSLKIQESGGKEIVLEGLRDTKSFTLKITPNYQENIGKYLIGIRHSGIQAPAEVRAYPIGQALVQGTKENFKLIAMTIGVLGKLVTFQLSVKTLGGPLMIAHSLGTAGKRGWAQLLYMMAFVSINLAILNLLPIPILDGGHLLFLSIEGVLRKPLGVKSRLVAQQIGLGLLLVLLIVVTMQDIRRLWGMPEWLKGLF